VKFGVHSSTAMESAVRMSELKLSEAKWRPISSSLEPSGRWKKKSKGYRMFECEGVSSPTLEVVDIVQEGSGIQHINLSKGHVGIYKIIPKFINNSHPS
jgi:hypothetical protein